MHTYKHYIRTDDQGRIIHGFSTAFEHPQDGDICINEQGGYQFRPFPGGEENPPLRSFDGNVPLYKWEGGAVVARTAAEIKADIPPPTPHIDPRNAEIDALRERVIASENALLALADAVIGGMPNE